MLGTLLLAMMVITPTDQTVQAAKGTKLEVNHSEREIVDIKQGEQALSMHSRSVRGGRRARLTTRSPCRNGWRSTTAASDRRSR